MKQDAELIRALRPVKRRIRVCRAGYGLCIGFLLAAANAAVWIAVSFWIPIERLAEKLLACSGSLLWIAPLGCALAPVGLLVAARRADACGLQERAVTAVTFGGDTPMAALQRRDAVKHLQALDVRKGLPFKTGKWHIISALCLVICACALLFVPNPQEAVLAERGAFQAAMQKQAEKSLRMAERIDETAYTPEELARLNALMRELAEKLRQSKDMREALEALNESEGEMQRIAGEADRRNSQALEQALKDNGLNGLADALAKQGQSALDEAMQALLDALEGENPNEVQEELADNLKEAGKAADESDSNAMQIMADALGAAGDEVAAMDASGAKGTNPALNGAMASLGSAMSNVQSGACSNVSALMKAMRAGVTGQSTGGNGSGGAQGNGTGAGGGTGNTPGQGTGSGAGAGSTNEHSGSGFAPVESSGSSGTRAGQYKTGEYEEIYDPTRTSGQSNEYFAEGQVKEGESQRIQLGAGLGDVSGSVPYNEVAAEYQAAASQAARRIELPDNMRQWVDDYFKSLVD